MSEKDTLFFDKPKFDTAHYKIIAKKEFDNHQKNRFRGYVIKLEYMPAAIDGGSVHYLTKEFGIIYGKSTTWPCYRRLHSTNDSLEKRITLYLENILSNTELVSEGDIPLKFYDKNFFEDHIQKIKF